MSNRTLTGIVMTSARTRDRLIAWLREQGITNPQVLERIRSVPRHLFVDEALATRAYEDTALPIEEAALRKRDHYSFRSSLSNPSPFKYDQGSASSPLYAK